MTETAEPKEWYRRTWVGLVAALMLTGCAASSTPAAAPAANEPPKKDTEGCATAQSALAAYADLRQGAQDQTLTPTDTANLMGKIREKMEAVSLIAAPELAASAKAASVAAGRLRVALSGQGDFDVTAENKTMASSLEAVALYCK